MTTNLLLADSLIEDLNSVVDDVLYEKAMEQALTILKNDEDILPIKDLQKKKIAYVNFGDGDGKPFLDQLRKYTKIDWVKASNLDSYVKKLKKYDYTIIGFHKSNANPWKDYKFTEKELVWIYEIARTNKVILDIFARPYALLDLRSSTNFEGILLSYQNSKVSQELSAQLIFGAREAKWKASGITREKTFLVNTSIETTSLRQITIRNIRKCGGE